MSFAWGAAIVAAGRGVRFGRSKQLLPVAGRPLVAWSVAAFASMPEVCAIAIATEAEWIDELRAAVAEFAAATPLVVVSGGATRQRSVEGALAALPAECEAVLVHDGARPLLRVEDVRAGMAQVRSGRGAVLATPAVDTIEVVDPETMRVIETLDRRRLWAAQTPQFATVDDLRRAHAAAREGGVEVTDDVAVLERIGVEVVVVESSSENFKVTYPEDAQRAETLLRGRSSRVGAAT